VNPTNVQAARAANIIYCILQYRRGLDREEMSPVSIVIMKLPILVCTDKPEA